MKPILIHKYANRKLYNRTKHNCTNLFEIVEFVKEGREITVISKKDGSDITAKTLLDAIYAIEKDMAEANIDVIKQVIRETESFTRFCLRSNSLARYRAQAFAH